MSAFNLEDYGINVKNVFRNLSPPRLYEEALRYEEGSSISASGAIIAYSGKKTGRSPKDKRVVRNPESENDVWWGPINIELDPNAFDANLERARDYLNMHERLYCVDAFAGWDPKHRIKVRVICARAYHALFMHIMLIRPTADELASYGEPEYVIYNAGQFSANTHTPGMTSKTSIDLCFETGEIVILGSEYAGEMKKGVFTVMNYLMPKKGILSMHCSATTDDKTGKSSVLFGLSGTGKTTLSADPHRKLIGDDEHCWTENGIFNIEGGCYAKAINLSAESEPEIYQALRYGSVLENVVFDKATREVDFADISITENTRGAYPIDYISNAKIPCVAGHPSDAIFLTCDAFGVLPPVSKLTSEQAMYHFISGYTAKVAGTEVGVTEPSATFSACFGAPFLVWHPGKYAELLAEKIKKHSAHVWLVNTGWSGGAYGVGKRMKLSYTRSIIDGIHSGALTKAPTQRDPIFGFDVIMQCPDVPPEVLIPINTWADKDAFEKTAKKLANLFIENFKQYEDGVSQSVRDAGPAI
ncbi:MAG: phosphoenolpyruvate carboxykinase (ATP) [Planctomycetes bacterium]|nr:phosphoenolpyruvate carboxykinase (ATP) [Planctomycetota bacterium]